MAKFRTRLNLSDSNFIQESGDTLTLSGNTIFVTPLTLRTIHHDNQNLLISGNTANQRFYTGNGSISSEIINNYNGSLLFRTNNGGSIKSIELTTGSTINVRVDGGSLRYTNDYSSNFGSRSLVDKGFVTGYTLGAFAPTNGISGLTVGGVKYIGLGGLLTHDTVIDVSGNSFSIVDDANSSGFVVDGETDEVSITHSQVGSFTLSPSGAIFSDTRGTKTGIEYAGNYASSFNARSLVDAGYVTGLTSSLGTITGGTNGLSTISGNRIGLGGNIFQNTILSGNSNNLDFFGLSNFSVYGGTNIVLGSAGNQAGYIEAIAVNGVDIGTQGDGVSFNLFAGTGDPVGITLSNEDGSFKILDNRVTPTGIQYENDYSANYTDRSLVDKAWVLNAVATGATVSGATNGLQLVSGVVALGGPMTQDTIITAANTYNLSFGQAGGEELVGFNIDTTGYSQWGLGDNGSLGIFSYNTVDGGGSIQVLPYGLQLNGGLTGAAQLLLTNNGFQATSGYGEVSLTGSGVPVKLVGQVGGDTVSIVMSPSATTPTIIIDTTSSTFAGLQYNGNYGTNFNAKSLVDKQYVTGLTSTIALANNGLTKRTGNNIGLGGTLTGSTTITTSGANRLNIAGWPMQYSADLSANFGPRSLVDKGFVTGITSTLTGNTVNANNGLTNRIGNNIGLGGTLTGNTTITTATGSRLNIAGWPMQYSADLSANYNIRSLVDRGYVTGITSTLSTTANNGLIKSGQNFRLGGTLTGNTTITTATGSRLNIAGWPMQYATNLASSYNSRSLVDSGYVSGGTYMSATNGITKSPGNVFRLGGALTGSTTLTLTTGNRLIISGWPIEYATNQTANYNAKSLVEKQYVTGITSTLVINANNGLTKRTGNNIGLGGALTGSTTITTTTSERLNIAGWPMQYTTDLSANYNIRSLVDRGYVTGITSTLVINANNGLTKKTGNNIGLGGTLTGNTTITTATGNRLIISGWPMEYATDLSANFAARSLVDKGFVTGITSTLTGNTVNANNGLTKKTGNNIGLGGTLTGNTTITTATGSRLNISGWPMQYTTDLSANFAARSLVDKGFVTGLTNILTAQIIDLSGKTTPVVHSFPMGVSSATPVTTGEKGIYTIPYSGTIVGWRLVSKQATTTVLDVWKINNAIPTIANTIFGTKPALTAAQLNSATGLSIAVTAGDVFILNVDSNSTSTYLRLDFQIEE